MSWYIGRINSTTSSHTIAMKLGLFLQAERLRTTVWNSKVITTTYLDITRISVSFLQESLQLFVAFQLFTLVTVILSLYNGKFYRKWKKKQETTLLNRNRKYRNRVRKWIRNRSKCQSTWPAHCEAKSFVTALDPALSQIEREREVRVHPRGLITRKIT